VAGVFFVNFLRFLAVGLWVLIFARVILSWLDPSGRNRVSAYVIQTTEPLLAPVRRLLPKTGMFDLSPLILLLILSGLMRVVG
jgi:YggT family protein